MSRSVSSRRPGTSRELVRALDIERYAVIGHSVGGGVAQLLALDHPGVDAMVLMSSTAFDAWPTLLTREIQRTPPDQEVELFVHSGMRASLRDRHGRPRSPDAGSGRRSTCGRGPAPRGSRRSSGSRDAMDGTGLVGRDDDLRALEIPVLIFWGEEDEFYPPAIAERLNETIPTSTLGLLPGCRHFLVEDAIETLGPMIYEYLRARYLHEPHGGHDEGSGIVTIQLERRPPWVDLAEVRGRCLARRRRRGGRVTTARLFLSGIRASGRHGARPGEKDEAQDFVVDLDIEVNVGDDDIAGTADYRGITEAVRAIVERAVVRPDRIDGGRDRRRDPGARSRRTRHGRGPQAERRRPPGHRRGRRRRHRPRPIARRWRRSWVSARTSGTGSPRSNMPSTCWPPIPGSSCDARPGSGRRIPSAAPNSPTS